MGKWEIYFDDYLSGQLTEDRKAKFEQDLRENPQLRADFDNHKAAKRAAEAFLESEVRETLKDLHFREENSKSSIFSLQSAIKYGAAAAVIGGLLFGIIWMTSKDPVDRRMTAAIPLEQLSLPHNEKRGQAANGVREDAVDAFKSGDLTRSLKLWRSIDSEESELYQARIAFRQKRFDDALTILNAGEVNEEKAILMAYIKYVEYGQDSARSVYLKFEDYLEDDPNVKSLIQ